MHKTKPKSKRKVLSIFLRRKFFRYQSIVILTLNVLLNLDIQKIDLPKSALGRFCTHFLVKNYRLSAYFQLKNLYRTALSSRAFAAGQRSSLRSRAFKCCAFFIKDIRALKICCAHFYQPQAPGNAKP